MFYSLVYTSVPTVIVGIFDKDISQRTLLEHPPLYGAGQRDENYNSLLFWVTMLDTLWQSLVLFYVPLYTYEISTIDIWSLGSLWTIAVVILVNLHLAMDVQRWMRITHLAIWGSIGLTFGCLFVLDAIKQEAFIPHFW
jgi:phospholipid-transporting ATPase